MRGGRDSKLKSMTGREEPSGPGTLIGIGAIFAVVSEPRLLIPVVAWEIFVAWAHNRRMQAELEE